MTTVTQLLVAPPSRTTMLYPLHVVATIILTMTTMRTTVTVENHLVIRIIPPLALNQILPMQCVVLLLQLIPPHHLHPLHPHQPILMRLIVMSSPQLKMFGIIPRLLFLIVIIILELSSWVISHLMHVPLISSRCLLHMVQSLVSISNVTLLLSSWLLKKMDVP